MSVMTRSKAKTPRKTATKTTKADPAQTARMTTRPAEAPDRGRVAEAPDAGEGRQALLDHQFTHGRSQS